MVGVQLGTQAGSTTSTETGSPSVPSSSRVSMTRSFRSRPSGIVSPAFQLCVASTETTKTPLQRGFRVGPGRFRTCDLGIKSADAPTATWRDELTAPANRRFRGCDELPQAAPCRRKPVRAPVLASRSSDVEDASHPRTAGARALARSAPSYSRLRDLPAVDPNHLAAASGRLKPSITTARA
jgi:hypothetical protein